MERLHVILRELHTLGRHPNNRPRALALQQEAEGLYRNASVVEQRAYSSTYYSIRGFFGHLLSSLAEGFIEEALSN